MKKNRGKLTCTKTFCFVISTKDCICKTLHRVVIFVINPSGFYSTFIGADLQYRNLLRFDRGNWSELRSSWDPNFESSLKMWWRGAGDFDGSQILVISEGFQGFSRRFLSFEILKLRAFLCFTLISNVNC